MAVRGSFISFEGIDGAGKSTQAQLLHERLRARGHPSLLTREPGGSPGAEDIRRLLVSGADGRWSAETEILLFTAARRDHLEKTIRPAIARGDTVLCDRFADSTRVYQGAVRGQLREAVDALHARMIACDPDLTLIIDMDPEQALARGLQRAGTDTRFEDMGLAFQTRLRDGFLALAREFPTRCRVIDGNRPEAEIADDIDAALSAALPDLP